MQEKERVETFRANIHSMSNKSSTIVFFQYDFVKEKDGNKSLPHFFKKASSPHCFSKADEKVNFLLWHSKI